jgi:glycosyltransferase involved in cell wall biosynthesis
MKIAIYHNIPDGGAKRALFYFTKILAEQGHILDLFTFNGEGEQYFQLGSYVKKMFTRPSPIVPMASGGYPLITNICNVQRQIKNIQRIRTVSQEFAGQINSDDYDVAFVTHCRYFQSPNILRYLMIPTIYYCQEPFRRFYEPSINFTSMPVSEQSSTYLSVRQPSAFLLKIAGLSHWLSQYMLKRNDQHNVRYARHILANSYYSREAIYRVYGKFARVNYLGVDAKLFRPVPEIKKRHLVLAVGRYFPIKQHHFVLNSLTYIPEEQRPELVIIGNEAPHSVYKLYLEQLANHHHISLQMLDNISDEELVAWYNRAKVVAFPPILEPFGFVSLEAMACQTPVVGIQEGGIRETILDNETGFLTERDEKAFGEAIYRLLQDDSLCQKMGENGRRHVSKSWTWERSVHYLHRHFHDAVKDYCKDAERRTDPL